MLFFCLGIFRFGQANISENNYYNQDITFSALIIREPDNRSDHTKLTLQSQLFKGYVLAKTSLYPEYSYGDLIAVACKIEKPEPIEEFSYDKYLARYKIYAICQQPKIELLETGHGNHILASIYKFKKILKYKLEKIWMVPSSSFMAGLLIGLKKELPESVGQYFKDTGTIHILVISGLHVLIISSLISQVLKHLYIPRPKVFYVMALVLGGFVILTGAAPSVLRAVLMALVVLLAEKVGRPKQIFNILVLVATIMIFFNPFILIYDMGFQLSFSATIGLVYLSDKIEKFLFMAPKFLGIKSLLAASLSAIFLTNPLIMMQFQKVSLIAPLANLIIVPFIPVIMMAGLLILGVSFVWQGLAVYLGWGVMIIIEFLIATVKFLASFSWSSVDVGEISWWWVAGFYVVVYLIVRRMNTPTDHTCTPTDHTCTPTDHTCTPTDHTCTPTA